jgi:hypothetical protein
MLSIVGGAYREVCLDPTWDYLFGSGVRAAAAVSALASQRKRSVKLHCWISESEQQELDLVAKTFGFELAAMGRSQAIEFQYDHPLGPPRLFPAAKDIEPAAPPTIETENALVFGLIETQPIIHASRLVYDPQAGANAIPLAQTGHKAKQTAIVANATEVKAMLSLAGRSASTKDGGAATSGAQLLKSANVDVVVVKNGADGAFLITAEGKARIPSYDVSAVFPIGSGDVFSAIFALHWAEFRSDPLRAATLASAATAIYCESRCLPVPLELVQRHRTMRQAPMPSQKRYTVYLAGPLYTVSQLWLLSECKRCLEEQGVQVFSPKDDVGFISEKENPRRVAAGDLDGLIDSNLVFAILEGLDAGTLFEVGYARAKGIPVIGLAQRVRSLDLTMLKGTDCEIFDDLSTAIYKAVWKVKEP